MRSSTLLRRQDRPGELALDHEAEQLIFGVVVGIGGPGLELWTLGNRECNVFLRRPDLPHILEDGLVETRRFGPLARCRCDGTGASEQ